MEIQIEKKEEKTVVRCTVEIERRSNKEWMKEMVRKVGKEIGAAGSIHLIDRLIDEDLVEIRQLGDRVIIASLVPGCAPRDLMYGLLS